MTTTFKKNVNTVGDFLVQHVLENPHDPVIHYGELGEATGTNPRGLGLILGEIGRRCKANYLPNITSIVVCKGTQEPGEGFLAHTPDAAIELIRVKRLNWQAVADEKILNLSEETQDSDEAEA